MSDKRSDSHISGIASNRQKELKSYSTDLYKHYELLCAGKGVPLSKGTYKADGLSFLPGERRSVKEMTEYPWQFGPGSPFDYVSQYVAVGPVPMSDFGKSSDIELEWQYIMGQQQAPKCDPFPYAKSKESDEGFVDDTYDKDSKECVARVETESSTVSSFLAGSNIEGSSETSTSKSSRISGNLSAEIDAAKAYPRDSAEWRTADSKELAALVSQKSHGYLENCDLPPSQSSFSWRGHVACSDSTPSKTVKAGSFPSREQDSLHDQNQSQGSLSMDMSDPTPIGAHLSSVSEPLVIPSASIPTRKYRSGKQGYETLGEALCHSQTRARQGEKLAAKALEEKDKVTELLFREAWTARTYKHWVETLELENRLLKMRSQSQSFSKQSIHDVPEQVGDRPWKHGRKRKKTNQRQWQGKASRAWASDNNAFMRCTIGLAFALGLSFAGAGLVIGWSMGWILLAN